MEEVALLGLGVAARVEPQRLPLGLGEEGVGAAVAARELAVLQRADDDVVEAGGAQAVGAGDPHPALDRPRPDAEVELLDRPRQLLRPRGEVAQLGEVGERARRSPPAARSSSPSPGCSAGPSSASRSGRAAIVAASAATSAASSAAERSAAARRRSRSRGGSPSSPCQSEQRRLRVARPGRAGSAARTSRPGRARSPRGRAGSGGSRPRGRRRTRSPAGRSGRRRRWSAPPAARPPARSRSRSPPAPPAISGPRREGSRSATAISAGSAPPWTRRETRGGDRLGLGPGSGRAQQGEAVVRLRPRRPRRRRRSAARWKSSGLSVLPGSASVCDLLRRLRAAPAAAPAAAPRACQRRAALLVREGDGHLGLRGEGGDELELVLGQVVEAVEEDRPVAPEGAVAAQLGDRLAGDPVGVGAAGPLAAPPRSRRRGWRGR